jgi:hypothetical protein
MTGHILPLGCSAFCLRNESDLWIARNLDVPFTTGYVLSNLRGIDKQSVVENDKSPAYWNSRWGSLTVNLLGADFPMGGINECGLLIEHLSMPGTVYPDRRECSTLLEFEWTQFMLENCSCVDDVRAQTEQVAILPGRVEMHFLLADGTGNCALLEFRDGQPLFYMGSSFQPPVVTNSWYKESVLYLSAFLGFGGDCIPSSSSTGSLDRFASLASAISNGFPSTEHDVNLRSHTQRNSRSRRIVSKRKHGFDKTATRITIVLRCTNEANPPDALASASSNSPGVNPHRGFLFWPHRAPHR